MFISDVCDGEISSLSFDLHSVSEYRKNVFLCCFVYTSSAQAKAPLDLMTALYFSDDSPFIADMVIYTVSAPKDQNEM